MLFILTHVICIHGCIAVKGEIISIQSSCVIRDLLFSEGQSLIFVGRILSMMGKFRKLPTSRFIDVLS